MPEYATCNWSAMKPPEETPEAYVALIVYRPRVAAWAGVVTAVPSRPATPRVRAARRRADLIAFLPEGAR